MALVNVNAVLLCEAAGINPNVLDATKSTHLYYHSGDVANLDNTPVGMQLIKPMPVSLHITEDTAIIGVIMPPWTWEDDVGIVASYENTATAVVDATFNGNLSNLTIEPQAYQTAKEKEQLRSKSRAIALALEKKKIIDHRLLGDIVTYFVFTFPKIMYDFVQAVGFSGFQVSLVRQFAPAANVQYKGGTPETNLQDAYFYPGATSWGPLSPTAINNIKPIDVLLDVNESDTPPVSFYDYGYTEPAEDSVQFVDNSVTYGRVSFIQFELTRAADGKKLNFGYSPPNSLTSGQPFVFDNQHYFKGYNAEANPDYTLLQDAVQTLKTGIIESNKQYNNNSTATISVADKAAELQATELANDPNSYMYNIGSMIWSAAEELFPKWILSAKNSTYASATPLARPFYNISLPAAEYVAAPVNQVSELNATITQKGVLASDPKGSFAQASSEVETPFLFNWKYPPEDAEVVVSPTQYLNGQNANFATTFGIRNQYVTVLRNTNRMNLVCTGATTVKMFISWSWPTVNTQQFVENDPKFAEQIGIPPVALHTVKYHGGRVSDPDKLPLIFNKLYSDAVAFKGSSQDVKNLLLQSTVRDKLFSIIKEPTPYGGAGVDTERANIAVNWDAVADEVNKMAIGRSIQTNAIFGSKCSIVRPTNENVIPYPWILAHPNAIVDRDIVVPLVPAQGNPKTYSFGVIKNPDRIMHAMSRLGTYEKTVNNAFTVLDNPFIAGLFDAQIYNRSISIRGQLVKRATSGIPIFDPTGAYDQNGQSADNVFQEPARAVAWQDTYVFNSVHQVGDNYPRVIAGCDSFIVAPPSYDKNNNVQVANKTSDARFDTLFKKHVQLWPTHLFHTDGSEWLVSDLVSPLLESPAIRSCRKLIDAGFSEDAANTFWQLPAFKNPDNKMRNALNDPHNTLTWKGASTSAVNLLPFENNSQKATYNKAMDIRRALPPRYWSIGASFQSDGGLFGKVLTIEGVRGGDKTTQWALNNYASEQAKNALEPKGGLYGSSYLHYYYSVILPGVAPTLDSTALDPVSEYDSAVYLYNIKNAFSPGDVGKFRSRLPYPNIMQLRKNPVAMVNQGRLGWYAVSDPQASGPLPVNSAAFASRTQTVVGVGCMQINSQAKKNGVTQTGILPACTKRIIYGDSFYDEPLRVDATTVDPNLTAIVAAINVVVGLFNASYQDPRIAVIVDSSENQVYQDITKLVGIASKPIKEGQIFAGDIPTANAKVALNRLVNRVIPVVTKTTHSLEQLSKFYKAFPGTQFFPNAPTTVYGETFRTIKFNTQPKSYYVGDLAKITHGQFELKETVVCPVHSGYIASIKPADSDTAIVHTCIDPATFASTIVDTKFLTFSEVFAASTTTVVNIPIVRPPSNVSLSTIDAFDTTKSLLQFESAHVQNKVVDVLTHCPEYKEYDDRKWSNSAAELIDGWAVNYIKQPSNKTLIEIYYAAGLAAALEFMTVLQRQGKLKDDVTVTTETIPQFDYESKKIVDKPTPRTAVLKALGRSPLIFEEALAALSAGVVERILPLVQKHRATPPASSWYLVDPLANCWYSQREELDRRLVLYCQPIFPQIPAGFTNSNIAVIFGVPRLFANNSSFNGNVVINPILRGGHTATPPSPKFSTSMAAVGGITAYGFNVRITDAVSGQVVFDESSFSTTIILPFSDISKFIDIEISVCPLIAVARAIPFGQNYACIARGASTKTIVAVKDINVVGDFIIDLIKTQPGNVCIVPRLTKPQQEDRVVNYALNEQQTGLSFIASNQTSAKLRSINSSGVRSEAVDIERGAVQYKDITDHNVLYHSPVILDASTQLNLNVEVNQQELIQSPALKSQVNVEFDINGQTITHSVQIQAKVSPETPTVGTMPNNTLKTSKNILPQLQAYQEGQAILPRNVYDTVSIEDIASGREVAIGQVPGTDPLTITTVYR